MSDALRPCNACVHYRTMGEKGFCFKHSKVLSSSDFACNDFSLKMKKEERKKRWIIDEKEERWGGAPSDTLGATELEKPGDTESARLRKTSRVKSRLFFDTEGGEVKIQLNEEDFDQGQRTFLAVLVGGLIVLLIVLFASGVF